jgi:hypothetical protein
MIDTQSLKNVRWYQKDVQEVVPVPVLGPDIIDPRQVEEIKRYTAQKLAEQQQAEVEEPAPVGTDGNQETDESVSTAVVSTKGQG